MPGHEVTDNGSKFTDLQSKAAVLPWRHAQGVFIEAEGSSMVARIEPTIESRLCKEVNLRSKLGVEKQCQTRVEEIVDFAVDESRRRLLEMITFEVNCAAQFGPKIILKRRERERAVQPIKKVFDLKCASAAGEEKETKRSQHPHINLTGQSDAGCATGKHTSNSVQSFSEHASLILPPCSRASSRAKFSPSPCPEIAETVPPRRNCSKMCGCASGGIGRPVLPTVSRT